MTKKFILVFLALMLTFTSNNVLAGYYQGKLIVKFERSSDFMQRAYKTEQDKYYPEFQQLLGEHKANRLIDNNILKTISKRRQSHLLSTRNKFNNIYDNLSRIYLVEFDSPIDPAAAARKIPTIPGIEYAEPMPERHIAAIPNDPGIQMQYYLGKVNSFEAWEHLDSTQKVILGVVDTGVYFDHEDLAENIYVNPGEYGKDNSGNDKQSNGIDDDDNGFVDDWRGWDFFSSTSETGQDNDPSPGHIHGTHVAGTAAAIADNGVGIAGVAINTKILAVKIGSDNSFSTSVYNSYEGILYAGIAGADVINCSWGGTNRSEAEQEIISAVEDMGAVVVAAAGNEAQEQGFYPAAYNNVLSIAAVDKNDTKAAFSNYHSSVDVTAPGVDIYSTIPYNPEIQDSSYDYLSGTSMASPVTAGVAAMVKLNFPDYSPLQIGEQIKATADDIDSLNLSYKGKIGFGRVNALRAVTDKDARSAIIVRNEIIEEDGDEIIDVQEKVEIKLSAMNVLAPIKDARIESNIVSPFEPEFINSGIMLGDMGTGDTISPEQPISFVLPEWLPLDYEYQVMLKVSDENGEVGRHIVSFIVRPSYRTVKENHIKTTFNSVGNIGYNDYPDNFQGEGFTYKGSSNLLYEGSLMIGIAKDRVSNAARGAYQMHKDRYFMPDSLFELQKPGIHAVTEGTGYYHDQSNDTSEVGVKVMQKIYQFNDAGRRDFIITIYDIVNTSGEFFDSLYAGLYFDWDLGPSGKDNKVYFENTELFGFIKNVKLDSLPYAGVLLLSSQDLNFFAIDNDGSSEENPGVWDGFTIAEKWRMLSGGIARRESGITDASMVIGAGPIRMREQDTIRVAFSLFAGNDIDELREAAKNSRETAKMFNIAEGNFSSIPEKDSLVKIYPNPAYNDEITIEFRLSDGSKINLDIIDIKGRTIDNVYNNKQFLPDVHREQYSTKNLSSGRYFVRFRTMKDTYIMPFNVLK